MTRKYSHLSRETRGHGIIAYDAEALIAGIGDTFPFGPPPLISDFRILLDSVVGVVHGIPFAHQGAPATEGIELYIGRSTLAGVFNRFIAHCKKRDHRFGIILAQIPTDQVLLYEKTAIKVISQLKQRGALCVANARVCDSGRRPTSDEGAVIYLTYKWKESESAPCKPGAETIDRIAHLVADSVNDKIAHLDIHSGLQRIRRRWSRLHVVWHPDQH